MITKYLQILPGQKATDSTLFPLASEREDVSRKSDFYFMLVILVHSGQIKLKKKKRHGPFPHGVEKRAV